MLEKIPNQSPENTLVNQGDNTFESKSGDHMDVRFTPEKRADGSIEYKSSNPSRKIVILEENSALVPDDGEDYEVIILKDTNPDDPQKGKLIARILQKSEGPTEERRSTKPLPLPIETDAVNRRLYVLQTEMPTKEGNVADAWLEGPFKYFTLDQRTLETLEKVATAVELHEPCLLEGETSTSKTSSIEYLAARTGNRVLRLNLNGQTDTSELIGKFIPNDGQLQIQFEDLLHHKDTLKTESKNILEKAHLEGRSLSLVEAQKIAQAEGFTASDWRWQDGLIPRAMKEGSWIILDEINLAEPQILERLNSVLEKNPSLTMTENDGVKIGLDGISPTHEDFRMFATMNPAEYAGRAPMSPAYKNRWTSYKFVPQPSHEGYTAMLNLMVYGEQPSVEINDQKYRAENVEPKFTVLETLPNFKGFLAKMAKFHVSLETLAKSRDIGRSKREGYTFTRRDLVEFLEYLEHKTIINRETHERISITDSPKSIILRAIQYFYLDKITNEEDLKKVTDQLDAIGISGKNWSHSFSDEPQTEHSAEKADNREDMRGKDPETFLNDVFKWIEESSPTSNWSSKETWNWKKYGTLIAMHINGSGMNELSGAGFIDTSLDVSRHDVSYSTGGGQGIDALLNQELRGKRILSSKGTDGEWYLEILSGKEGGEIVFAVGDKIKVRAGSAKFSQHAGDKGEVLERNSDGTIKVALGTCRHNFPAYELEKFDSGDTE